MYALPIGLVCTAFLLSGCGGSDPARSFETAARCELPLKHADGATSGIRIDPQASAVPRKFNPCSIQKLESAQVSLCLGHGQIGDLRAELILPNQEALVLNLDKAVRSQDCLNNFELFTLHLPLREIQAFQALEGDWSVKVSDQVVNTPIGFLVGWSMLAEGLK